MANLLWLIDEDYYEGETDGLKAAIKGAGMDWSLMPREDYYMDRLGRNIDEDQPCIAICTLQVGKKLRHLRPWMAPGVVCDLERLKCSWYYPRVGRDLLLNGHCVYVTWAELPNMLPELKGIYGSHMFIRPDKGDKGFSGTVVSVVPDEFSAWLKKDYEFSDQFMAAEDLVLVDTALSQSAMEHEYRTFVVGGKVVAQSEYKAAGRSKLDSKVPGKVVEFAQTVADGIGSQFTDIGYVIDVAESDQGELKVIELNSLSCSGMYAADPAAIVKAVADEWGKPLPDTE
jgi:hypothetical protein